MLKHKKTILSALSAFTATVLGVAAFVTPALATTYKYDSFENIDVDRSGFLESGEYRNYAFGKADWDKDGYLEESEWVKYTEIYYDPYDLTYDSYSEYDVDGDGVIDYYEFDEIPTTSLFNEWDYDDDNQITDTDWDRVSVYYQDKE